MAEYLAKAKKVKFNSEDAPRIGLFPTDLLQQEKLKKLKPDDVVTITFKRFRSKNRLDMAHAINFYLWMNWREKGHYPNKDVFRDYMSLELGFSYPVHFNGKIIDVPKTWSYKTDEEEFTNGLYDPLVKFACEYFDVDIETLINDSKKHYRDHKFH